MTTPRPFYAVIMAGGRGERFWPASTSKRPKQLLDLVGDKPLIAQAVDRIEPFIPADHVFVITNDDLVEATCAALPNVPVENIVGEPMGRDTAAAAALGCAMVQNRDEEAAFCILTADQVMGDLERFQETILQSLELSLEQDVLITIGITPAHPDTGFGYICAGDAHEERGGIQFNKVQQFVEKPDLKTAQGYLAEGNYFWNSGMFIWSVDSFRHGMSLYCLPLLKMMDKVRARIGQDDFDHVLLQQYEQLKKISIDYALMEKADNIVMAVGTFVWDDVGSWPALENHFPADDNGNVTIGNAEHLDGSGNIVLSRDRLTATIGMKDTIIVQADGVTLVCPKDRAQDIKKLVQAVHARGDSEDLL